MVISLYSSPSCWLLVPANEDPPAAAKALCGKLTFESSVPSSVIVAAVWAGLQIELLEQRWCRISEDFALLLLDECVNRYGTIPLKVSIECAV